MTEFLACGGFPNTVAQSCSTFNLATGNWDTSYNLPRGIFGHVAWKNSLGVLLMGGYGGTGTNHAISVYQTIQLSPGGSATYSFNLTSPSVYSCAIDDYRSGTVIITGNQYSSGGAVMRAKVVRYDEAGFVEYLPDLNYGRWTHGCGGYYDDAGNMVGFDKI